MKRKKTFIHKVTFIQEDKKVYVYIRQYTTSEDLQLTTYKRL